jgi:hypothetical protein
MQIETPTLNKMQSVKNQSQALGEFLEWLQSEKHFSFGTYHKHDDDCYDDYEEKNTCGYYVVYLNPVRIDIEVLLAEYFDIDLNAVEREKRAILKSLRND